LDALGIRRPPKRVGQRWPREASQGFICFFGGFFVFGWKLASLVVFLFEIQLTPRRVLINLNWPHISVVRQCSEKAGPPRRPSIRKGERKDEKDCGYFICSGSGLFLFEFVLLPLLAGLLPILLGNGVALLSTGGNSGVPGV
jgi:hypothetical protein